MTEYDEDRESYVHMWLHMLHEHGWDWVMHWATIIQYCKGRLSDGTVSS